MRRSYECFVLDALAVRRARVSLDRGVPDYEIVVVVTAAGTQLADIRSGSEPVGTQAAKGTSRPGCQRISVLTGGSPASSLVPRTSSIVGFRQGYLDVTDDWS